MLRLLASTILIIYASCGLSQEFKLTRDNESYAIESKTERNQYYYSERSTDLQNWYYDGMPSFIGDGTEVSFDLSFPLEKLDLDDFFVRIHKGEKIDQSEFESGVPVLILHYKPFYPVDLRAAGVEGSVTIEFILEANGAMRNFRIFASTHPEFSEAALEAIVHWKYYPARENGNFIPSIARQQFVFIP